MLLLMFYTHPELFGREKAKEERGNYPRRPFSNLLDLILECLPFIIYSEETVGKTS